MVEHRPRPQHDTFSEANCLLLKQIVDEMAGFGVQTNSDKVHSKTMQVPSYRLIVVRGTIERERGEKESACHRPGEKEAVNGWKTAVLMVI